MLRSSNVNLGDTIIEKLSLHNVHSILDFVNCRVDKLASIISLTEKEILILKQKLIEAHSPKVINAWDLFQHCLINSAILPTQIDCIDKILNGGIETGSLYELYGLSGSGKTQICLSLCANLAQGLKRRIIYVDSKQDFSATRIYSILSNKKFSDQEIQSAMQKVEVKKVRTFFELSSVLHSLIEKLRSGKRRDCRLIIIDSLTTFYLPYIKNSSEGLGLLSHIAMMLKWICRECHVACIVTNLGLPYTDAVEGEEEEEEECEEDTSTSHEVRPAMGRFWSHIPDHRLLVQRTSIDLTKSTTLPLSKSELRITSLGVT